MKKLFFLLLLVTVSFNIYSQRDTEFWFACPDLSEGHSDDKIYLYFVTFDKPAQITVSQPANNYTDEFAFPPLVIDLEANSYHRVHIGKWKHIMEIQYGMVLPFGLRITSTESIVCFYANNSNNSEVYTLKGKNALGTDFIVPMQYEYANSSNYGGGICSIQIVATEDNTNVVVEPTARIPDEIAEDGRLYITLNRGEAYTVRATSRTGAGHLHNTRVSSNKPIAVNYTDDTLPPGGEDLLGDQLIPISMAGTEYIAVTNGGNIEKLYIFPTQDDTELTINGVKIPEKLSQSNKDKYAYTIKGETAYLLSDKPVIVFQMTTSGVEPGGAVLPHMTCTGSMEAVYQSAFTASDGSRCFLNLITKKDYIDGFTVTIDGTTTKIAASNFKPVANTNSEWYYYRYPVATKSVVRVKNELGYFHMGAYDYDTRDSSSSYGYFSDYQTLKLTPTLSQNYYLEGDKLRLVLSDAELFDNIIWMTPGGDVFTGPELEIEGVTVDDSGLYSVTADNKYGCMDESTAYIYVNIFNLERKHFEVCYGHEIDLTADGVGPYIWEPGTDLPDAQTITVSPEETTTYTVVNNKYGGNMMQNGDFQDLVENRNIKSDYFNAGTGVSEIPLSGMYSVNTKAVSEDGYSTVYDHTLSEYLPNSGKHMIVKCKGQAGDNIWTKTVDVMPNTDYNMSAWFITPEPFGLPAQLYFSINDELIGEVISPPNAKEKESRADAWQRFSSGIWNSGYSTQAVISIVTSDLTLEGVGVCIDDITFSPMFEVTDTMEVKVLDELVPEITGDEIICDGKAVLEGGMLNEDTPYASYSWYLLPNDSVALSNEQVFSATVGGTYRLEVTHGTCIGINEITIPDEFLLDVTLDASVQACQSDPAFSVSYSMPEGELAFYNIKYDDAAKAAGFVDMSDQPVNENDLPVVLPANVVPGTYRAEIQVVSNSDCGVSKTLPVEIIVKIASDQVMAQKWNDVIALYNEDFNGGYRFVAYQWYKNGEIMPGEVRSYINLNNVQLDPNDRYSALLTRDDGQVFLTCDFIPEIRNGGISLPTLVSPSQILTVPVVEGADTYKGIATFSNLNGVIHSRQNINNKDLQIKAPDQSGLYILEVNLENERKQYKVLVK